MYREPGGPGPTRRIAILAPMPLELRPLVSRLGLVRSRERNSDFLWGESGRGKSRVELVAALTGIGMRAGARAASRILDAASPDRLVVVGIAGGIGEVEIGDLIVPELVLDLDTGETHRPIPLGDVPPRGTLVSSDSLLEAPGEIQKLKDQGVVAIDMETAAIGAVCEQRGCPWSVFRAISDRADDGTTDAAILALAGSSGRPDPAAVARFLLTHPHRIPQLVRLARGASLAARTAAVAAVDALRSG